MAAVKAREAKIHFSKLFRRVALGEKITVTRYGASVALLLPFGQKMSKLTHKEIVEGMRALRKRVKPEKLSIREMIAEGRRH